MSKNRLQKVRGFTHQCGSGKVFFSTKNKWFQQKRSLWEDRFGDFSSKKPGITHDNHGLPQKLKNSNSCIKKLHVFCHKHPKNVDCRFGLPILSPLSVQLSLFFCVGKCYIIPWLIHCPCHRKKATELIVHLPKLWPSTELRFILKPLPWPATPGHRPKANLIQKRGGLGGVISSKRGDEVTKSFLEDAVNCSLSWKTYKSQNTS